MANLPKISITIPCRNELNYIEANVRSIMDNDYPQDLFKLFVVDGMSDDGTVELVNRLCEEFPGRLELIENQEKVTPHALNLGLKREGFDLKIIFGAHAKMDKNYLKSCAELAEQHPEVGCFGGVITNVYENDVAKVVGLAMSSKFGVGGVTFRIGGEDGYVDTVAFGAYRAKVFEDVGYFDEELVRNQDDEFNFRVLKGGWKIYFAERIQSDYYVRASLKKLFHQYYQYGYWKVFVNVKHQTITTVRQLIPFFFVSYLLLLPFSFLLGPTEGGFCALGLVAYAALSLRFAFQQSKSLPMALKVARVFWILHFSYGLGFLLGILNFVLLRKKPGNKSKALTR